MGKKTNLLDKFIKIYYIKGKNKFLVQLVKHKSDSVPRIFGNNRVVQVRTISFSHDGVLLASASEDMEIDIGHVETTEKVAEIAVDSPTFTVSWHPSRWEGLVWTLFRIDTPIFFLLDLLLDLVLAKTKMDYGLL